MSGKGDKKAADGGRKKDVSKLDIHYERREKTVERAVVHSQGSVDKTKNKVVVNSPQPKKDAAAGHRKPDQKSDKKDVKKELGKTKTNTAIVGGKEKTGGGDRKHGNKIVSMPNDRGGVGMTGQCSWRKIVTEERKISHTKSSGRTVKCETHTTSVEVFAAHRVDIIRR